MDQLVIRQIEKFQDPLVTAEGDPRAFVELSSLKTLWFNTGSQCNLTCDNCYIESSPHNDRLSYLTLADVNVFLQEIVSKGLPTSLIGFTGGEPFLNPDFVPMLTDTLRLGFNVLVLTNGFRRIDRYKSELLQLNTDFGKRLQLRISLDHYSREVHEEERGSGTFAPTMKCARWLAQHGFRLSIAGRAVASEERQQTISGYQRLFEEYDLGLDAESGEHLVVFPEMDLSKDVPEITVACWDVLGKKPEQQMCASERMIVKRKGSQAPTVLPCTLLAYDKQFDLGASLESSARRVQLNHKFCAQFCVLGGASCSSTA
ncbi:MAG: radical SAM protein [Congregibacter sp.]